MHRATDQATREIIAALDLLHATCREIDSEMRARIVIHKAADHIISRIREATSHLRTALASLGVGVRDEMAVVDPCMDIVKVVTVKDASMDGRVVRIESSGYFRLDGSGVIRPRQVIVGKCS
jgi:hypothetical protein